MGLCDRNRNRYCQPVELVALYWCHGARISGRTHCDYPSMVGMGLPVPILSLVGLAAILALQVSDPSAWLCNWVGPLWCHCAAFVIAANLGTAIAGVYATAVGLRQVPAFSTMSWIVLPARDCPGRFVTLLVPDLFFSNFGTFLAFIGVFFSPYAPFRLSTI